MVATAASARLLRARRVALARPGTKRANGIPGTASRRGLAVAGSPFPEGIREASSTA
jgi:hypothetical protein